MTMIELLILLGLIVVAWFVLGAIIAATVTVIEFLLLILVWMFIGWVAGQLIRGKGYGPVYDGLLGLGGGIVGNILFSIIGINLGGVPFVGTIITGIVGALILVVIIRFFSENKDFAS
jgi:uncharacterized membrane protein YeaQ/YmgE (transglycosylase-associated protein family)